MLHHVNIGLKVKQCVHQIPSVTMEASIQPITRTVLRVTLSVCADFTWSDQVEVTVPISVLSRNVPAAGSMTLVLKAYRKFSKNMYIKDSLKTCSMLIY